MNKKRPKSSKFLNNRFGSSALLETEIADFLKKASAVATDAEMTAFKETAGWLARLAVHPEDLADDAELFARFYAKHPRFVLEFMVAMRRACFAKSKGEQWLHTFDGMARQNLKDEALMPDLKKLGMGSTELRTARATLRKRESLQHKQKLL